MYFCVSCTLMKRKESLLLLGFFLLNLMQAAFTDLTGDEALYWMHWNNLDWGFRDHPPAIGTLIGMGYALFSNEIGARLLVVVAGTFTVWLTYKLTQPKRLWLFALLVLSMPFLNIYSFIATPDAPLLLGVVLYFTALKLFMEKQDACHTLFLGIAMAVMVWSKYHGVFIIVFSLLPLRKFWFNSKFWIAALTGIVLFSPHIIWQIANDLPTIKFHLNDRNSDAWELKHILGYAGGQFLVFNPFVFVLIIFVMISSKPANLFEKSLRWIINGLLILFFFNSFRGRVEPHWTAPLAIAMIYLIIKYWEARPPQRKMITGLSTIIALILMGRICMIVDILPPLYREFHRDKPKVLAIHQLAGELPVCFMNTYQLPSLYMFYNGGIAHSINNVEGGKNQYDYWNYNEAINKRPFLFVASYEAPGFTKDTVGKFAFDVMKYDDLPVMHGLKLWTDESLYHYHLGDSAGIAASIINKNSYAVNLNDSTYYIRWRAMFNHKKFNEANEDIVIENLPTHLEPGESVRVVMKFKVPECPGKNYLMIATQVDELPATYQSNKMRMMIEE